MTHKINRSSIGLRFVLIVAFATMIAACGKLSSPSSTMKGFLGALKAEKYEKAVEHFEPAILEEPGAKEKLTSLLKQEFSKDPLVKFKILDEEIAGDEAEVLVSLTQESGDEDEDSFDLVRVDGSWYLTMN